MMPDLFKPSSLIDCKYVRLSNKSQTSRRLLMHARPTQQMTLLVKLSYIHGMVWAAIGIFPPQLRLSTTKDGRMVQYVLIGGIPTSMYSRLAGVVEALL